MAVGNFGSLIQFRVSDKQVLTFQNLTKQVKGRWGTLTPCYGKPVSYFMGKELDTVSMDITLDATLGVRPYKMLKRIENAVENGTAEMLIIGGKRMCRSPMKITSVSEAYDVVLRRGEVLRATVSISLEEY